MYRVNTGHYDGRISTFIMEDYEGEALEIFKEAELEAGEEVEVTYVIDSTTGEDIELWKRDWL